MKARDKRFLSESVEEFGSVSWCVHSAEKSYDNPVEASLRITDCHNVVNLDFDCRNPDMIDKHLSKRITKLDTLIESLIEMRTALVKVGTEVSDRKKVY
jgi:hypothetical protein